MFFLHLSSIDLSKIKEIKFTLGIPFELNHLNPLTQTSPLNVPTMFWVWQTGHKFLRFEMLSEDDSWLFHLGSTGCSAPSPMRPPSIECRHENRYEITLPLQNASSVLLTNNNMELISVLKLDLAALLKNISTGKENNCQSSPSEISCQKLFKNLAYRSDKKKLKEANTQMVFSSSQLSTFKN